MSTLNAGNEVEFHYRVYTALDIVDEKLASGGVKDSRELFLGLLHATEEHKMYPLCSTKLPALLSLL